MAEQENIPRKETPGTEGRQRKFGTEGEQGGEMRKEGRTENLGKEGVSKEKLEEED